MGGGDCYKKAVENAIMADGDLYVVHGLVTGDSGDLEGVVYPHAWNETVDGLYVIDTSNGNDICMPLDVYYELGRINEDMEEYCYNCYTLDDVTRLVSEYGHYGPWDDDTMDFYNNM